MTLIGFHASHEQASPSRLLEDVRLAEAAGFGAAMCSDHIEPWSHRQGHSGFAWSWLGAALATTDLRFGVVTATGFRYHPVVTAQATATLASMFPQRFWFALGSGEHCNERMSGVAWPPKEERQQLLGENLDIVRRLPAGEVVDHDGAVKGDRGRVWDRPETPPDILLPALTPETAGRFADRVDGLVTVNAPLEDLQRILGAYRDGGGRGRTVLQVHLSWAPTRERAREIAREQWATNALPPELMAELATAEEFESHAAELDDGDLEGAVIVSDDPAEHVDRLCEFAELGFDEIYLHHVGPDQRPFIDTFGDTVLPYLP